MATPDTINTLLRQSARWTTAAEQDSNPLIAVLHANYGMAYITALRQVASDSAVYKQTGHDPRTLEKYIAGVQDEAVRRFAQHVPDLVPQSPMAVIAGEAAPLTPHSPAGTAAGPGSPRRTR